MISRRGRRHALPRRARLGKGADVRSRGHSRVAALFLPALFAAGYLASAEAGKLLSVPNQTYVSFWLPAGVYVAALLGWWM